VGLQYVDLGLELPSFLTSNNQQQIDDLLDIGSYLRSTPPDFGGDEHVVSPVQSRMSTGGLSPQSSPSSPTHMSTGIITQPRVAVQKVSIPKVASSPVTLTPRQKVGVASRTTQSKTTIGAIKGNITTNTRNKVNSINANTNVNAYTNPNTTNATNTTTNANITPNRTAYKQPLTQEQKDLINGGKAPLPVSEDNTTFNNNIQGLCSKEACKLAIEAWWSGCTSTQLISIKDFKQQVPQIKACSKCSHSNNTPKILQSMSAFKSILVIESKRSVPLFEIKRKQ